MENNSSDQKVIDLLSKLKNNQTAYPSDLLELRRQKYLQQAAHAGLGIGAGAGLKNTLKGRWPGLPPTAGTWLGTVLVVAIIAGVIIAAYLYRHKLVNLFETFLTTTRVQEVTALPVVTSPFPVTEISVVPTASLTKTPTVTPAPSITDDNNSNSNSNGNNDNNNDAGGGNSQAASTPDPNGNNSNNGNNGNHFGQTKQPPQETKEPKDTKVPNNVNPNTKVPKNK